MDLSTDYAGLKLNNPIIVAPAGITEITERMKQAEQAVAVVVKTLFEKGLYSKKSQKFKKFLTSGGLMVTILLLLCLLDSCPCITQRDCAIEYQLPIG